jgi:hypothetical protein
MKGLGYWRSWRIRARFYGIRTKAWIRHLQRKSFCDFIAMSLRAGQHIKLTGLAGEFPGTLGRVDFSGSDARIVLSLFALP